jgi:acyl-CoA thioesterase-1
MKSMRVIGCGVTLLAILAVSLAHAAEAKKAKEAEKPDPALVPVQDDPSLPRALLIGDSISMGYTVPVREALAGKANVHHPPVNCGPTIRGVEQLDAWLGDGRWDVIHFNFGLHDLKVMRDGNRQVPPDKYEKNLREIVARLKKTGATLVWCTTTPVPAKSNPPRSNDDVQAYNAVGRKIMEENAIRISDLYEFALPRIQEIQIPDNVHFTPEGSKVLAERVSQAIQEALASGKK